jgi:hypothetical protein
MACRGAQVTVAEATGGTRTHDRPTPRRRTQLRPLRCARPRRGRADLRPHARAGQATDPGGAHTTLVEAGRALPRIQRSLTELSAKQEVARRTVAFDMSIVHAGRRRPPEFPLDELLRTAHCVCPHAPLTDGTRQLLDAGRLAPLHADRVRDQQAQGAPGGAGIDVFDPEGRRAERDGLPGGRPRDVVS